MSMQPAASAETPISVVPVEGLPTPKTAVGKLASLNGSLSPANGSHLPSKRSRSRSKQVLLLLLLAVLLVAGAGGATWYFLGNGSRVLDLVTHEVKRELMEFTIVERGTLESAENSDVYCRVKARSQGNNTATSIRWVIDDGSYVRRGQTLVELDDSFLNDQLTTHKVTLERARAEWVQAEENYKIVLSQNESDIAAAKTIAQISELDLDKYLNGDYEQKRKDILGRSKIAESNLDMWRERVAWAERMNKLGYYTGSQTQSERAKKDSAEIELKRVQEELRVLEDYDKKRTLTDLGSKLDEARRAFIRVIATAQSKKIQAEADRLAKRIIYRNEEDKHEEIEDEIRKCKIVSPQDGMVVYYIPESSRYGSSNRQVNIAQNESVAEGQRLMRIPNLRKMQVNTRVHEAMVSRVRGEIVRHTGYGEWLRAGMLVSPDSINRLLTQWVFFDQREKLYDKEHVQVYGGQHAQVRVDAFPSLVLNAHVKTVATVASQNEYFSSDVKVYQTLVTVDDPIESIQIDGKPLELKPGMSAEVTILTDRRPEPVLTVPVEAVIGSPALGRKRKVFVVTPQGPQEREVTVGMTNDKVVEIREGLQEGDVIVRNPQRLLSDQDKARFANEAKAAAAKGGKGKGDWAGRGGPPPGDYPEGGGGDFPAKVKGKGKGKRPPMDMDPPN